MLEFHGAEGSGSSWQRVMQEVHGSGGHAGNSRQWEMPEVHGNGSYRKFTAAGTGRSRSGVCIKTGNVPLKGAK